MAGGEKMVYVGCLRPVRGDERRDEAAGYCRASGREEAFLLVAVAEVGEQEGGGKGKRLTISQFFNNKHLAE